MSKSYVAKTTINLIDHEFYIRSGDILVHDTANDNKLIVYRGGNIIKVVKQTVLGILAMLKNKFIEEVPVQLTTTAPPIQPKVEVKPKHQIRKDFKEVIAKDLTTEAI